MSFIVLVISLLPGFAWLYFYLQEDEHPEPKRLIALTFLVGTVAAFVALVAEDTLSKWFGWSFMGSTGTLFFAPLIVFAFVEEITKFGAAYVSVHKRPEFDEPVDAMIYAVVAALGFATLENIGVIVLHDTKTQTAIVQSALETASLRFVGATLLHTLTSALVGYYWAMTIRGFSAFRYLISGLIAATLLHAIFNYLIISFGGLGYALLFVVVFGFFILIDFEKLRGKAV